MTCDKVTDECTRRVKKAGFWIRLIAIVLDVFLIYWFVKCIEWCLYNVGIYIPRELTFCLVFAAYSIVSIIVNGRTIGKAMCGLVVHSEGTVGTSLKQAILREIICKPLSGLCLGLGFLWAGFSRSKRAWHDRMTKTAVFRTGVSCKWLQYVMFAICFLMVISIGRKAIRAKQIITDIRTMTLPADVNIPYLERDPNSLREISSLNQSERNQLKDWLDGQELEPIDYLVQTSTAHQVTIIGEVHGKKEYLDLLNDAVSRLYHEAGVRCIALEVCLTKDNKLLNQLVTAPQFDRDLAMKIARHMNWRIWGRKEYWDVFEAVWHVNQKIPEGQHPLRVIGLSPPVDMPSFMLVAGAADGKVKPPLWERLRIFRIWDDLIVELKRDELMARAIEREIIEKNDRAVVWVGLNHAFTHYKVPMIRKRRIVRSWSRMGWILHQRYGSQIFQIALHDDFFLPGVGGCIESLMKEGRDHPVGFSFMDSPFSDLRDSRVDEYALQPGLRFVDKAPGYIYIKPRRALSECTWLRGYISEEMFVRNKPFYQAWAKAIEHHVTNAQQADLALEIVMTTR